MEGLTVGRVVHVLVAAGECRAAMVNRVHGASSAVDLTLFHNPDDATGQPVEFVRGIRAGAAIGSYHDPRQCAVRAV